jgi:hypothetical protein
MQIGLFPAIIPADNPNRAGNSRAFTHLVRIKIKATTNKETNRIATKIKAIAATRETKSGAVSATAKGTRVATTAKFAWANVKHLPLALKLSTGGAMRLGKIQGTRYSCMFSNAYPWMVDKILNWLGSETVWPRELVWKTNLRIHD